MVSESSFNFSTVLTREEDSFLIEHCLLSKKRNMNNKMKGSFHNDLSDPISKCWDQYNSSYICTFIADAPLRIGSFYSNQILPTLPRRGIQEDIALNPLNMHKSLQLKLHRSVFHVKHRM